MIEKLLSQNLIKYNANGNIVPCHDIYKIFYQEHFKPLQSDFLLSDRGLTEITSMISSGLFSIAQIYDYIKELRKLIIDQKFYTVKYILENLFQIKNDTLHNPRNLVKMEDYSIVKDLDKQVLVHS